MSDGEERVVAADVDAATFHFWIDSIFGSMDWKGEVPRQIRFDLRID
jgi:hypothetical protein